MRALPILLGLVVGCGGSRADFIGTWEGTRTVFLADTALAASGGELEIDAVSSSLYASDVCPGGGGRLELSPAGEQILRWTGVLECDSAPVGDCDATTVTLDSAEAVLLVEPGPQLVAGVSGQATGCGSTRPVSMNFVGARATATP